MASIPAYARRVLPHAVIRERFGSIRHGPFALTGAPIHEPIVSRMQRAAETPFRRDAAVTYDAAIESFILPAPTAAPAPTGAGQLATEQQARGRRPLDTVVWVNTKSDIYHFAGTHYYGNTKYGTYMFEVWDLYV